ncbi:nucleophile aminohydrolase [Russula dissimulans]|nr:nucleophile aminohydrolase [Russula dissimulans]
MSAQAGQVRNPTSGPFYVVAAHGGAGYHSPTSDSSLNRSLRAAVSSAFTTFSTTTTSSSSSSNSSATAPSKSSSSALDTTTMLIAALEDAPDFNAGYGSNLTFDGHVECDASLMSSTSSSSFLYGSVGAVRGVRNPVLLARRVLEGRRRRESESERGHGRGGGLEGGLRSETRMGMGRVPPLMLVGEGAVRFARAEGVPVLVGDELEGMVAPRARREWALWRERCRRWEEEEEEDSPLEAEQMQGVSESENALLATGAGAADSVQGAHGGGESLRARQDTVGAVVLVGCEADDGVEHQRQQVAAGVSSGGLLLKQSGRVGEAAVFGAGCWAERLAGGHSVACSVSGQGELIVQSSLAKTLAESIAAGTEDDTHDILRSVLVDQFYDKWRQRGEYQPAVGVLLLTQGLDGDEHSARLWCAFTTQSMAIAYASSRHPKPKATVLRNTAHDFRTDDGRPPVFITSFPC